MTGCHIPEQCRRTPLSTLSLVLVPGPRLGTCSSEREEEKSFVNVLEILELGFFVGGASEFRNLSVTGLASVIVIALLATASLAR